MGRITLVIGGARSGKSAHAEKIAGLDRRVAYIATGEARDEEMRERVRLHRARRPKTWRTYERGLELDTLLLEIGGMFDAVLIDDAMLFVANMFMEREKNPESQIEIQPSVEALAKAAAEISADVIIVAAELGAGVVPMDASTRRFRDLVGLANQQLASAADTVYYVIAGIPWKIKPKSEPPSE